MNKFVSKHWAKLVMGWVELVVVAIGFKVEFWFGALCFLTAVVTWTGIIKAMVQDE